jgi:serine/threonine-protein kinase
MGCLDENTVVEFIDGLLDPEQRAEAEEHLARCPDCRRLVARTAEALLPTGAVSSEVPLPMPLRGLRHGDSVGRYRVLHRVGAGAMGVVYAAEDQELRRRVALKLLRADPSQPADLLRARLIREARAASAIRHPNVVPVHDVLALDDGSPVLVMDLLVGEPLRERLERKGPLTFEETARILIPVVSALEAAHALGVVHRDLKPDNIFLSTTDSGELDVKIVDFGVAKLTALEGPAARTAGLTESGALVGTPYYMSPEQAFGEKDIDPRADLWAVGVILYECLSGSRPTEASNVGQVLKALAHLRFPPIEQVAPTVPAGVAALIGRLLCEREDRIQTATELRRLLESLATSPLVASLPPAVLEGDAAFGGSASQDTTLQRGATTRLASTSMRGRSTMVGAVLVVLLVAAAVVFGGARFAPWAAGNADVDAPPSASSALAVVPVSVLVPALAATPSATTAASSSTHKVRTTPVRPDRTDPKPPAPPASTAPRPPASDPTKLMKDPPF